MRATPRPTVTIGVPVHNGGPHLRAALSSLLQQDYRDFELLIRDNASSDDTQAIAAGFAQEDPRVHVERQATLVPPERNFNAVLQSARGELFMWAAADDLWSPDLLGALVNRLKTVDTAALAFGGFVNMTSNGADIVRTFEPMAALSSPSPLVRLRTYLQSPEHHGKANLIYGLARTPTLRAIGGMRRWGLGAWGFDMLSVFRLLLEGPVAWSDRGTFYKRLGETESPPCATDTSAVRLRHLAAWHGYLAGYTRIISSADQLTRSERRELLADVMKLAARVDAKASRRVLARQRSAP